MRGYERARRSAERTPGWRSSEGRMWEAEPARRKEGRDHLTGYEPHPVEEARDRPREAARMAGSYGDVAVGVNRKKEVTLVVSKRRSREGPPAVEDERTLKGGSARRMHMSRGNFRVNAHSQERSAVGYREAGEKQPAFMLEKFKGMMRTRKREQETLAEQVPFLNLREEEGELVSLREREEALRERRGTESELELRQIEGRRQRLRQSMTEKKSQERRLRMLLAKAREEALRRGGEEEPVRRFAEILRSEAELPPGDGSDPENGEGSSEETEEEAAAPEGPPGDGKERDLR